LIENTKEYNGKYFVLGSLLSPIDGIGPKEIRMNELSDFLNNNQFKEIVLAIAPTTEGETTIQFLADFLDKKVMKITRLSTGIPYGGDMEYTGTTTMINALKRRFEV
jgi:recombination protein RecR